jgi:hypothetical protein
MFCGRGARRSRVRGGRDGVGERGEVGGAADVVELAGSGEAVGDGDEIDGLPALEQLDHDLKDHAVRIAVEVVGAESFDGAGDGVAVEKHRAEHALFSFEIVRRGLFRVAERGIIFRGEGHAWLVSFPVAAAAGAELVPSGGGVCSGFSLHPVSGRSSEIQAN